MQPEHAVDRHVVAIDVEVGPRLGRDELDPRLVFSVALVRFQTGDGGIVLAQDLKAMRPGARVADINPDGVALLDPQDRTRNRRVACRYGRRHTSGRSLPSISSTSTSTISRSKSASSPVGASAGSVVVCAARNDGREVDAAVKAAKGATIARPVAATKGGCPEVVRI